MTAGLVKRGVRVSLIELGPGAPPTWLAEAPGVKYQSLNAKGKIHYPSAVKRLAAMLKSENVDILHTHLFFAGVIGVLSKWLQRRTIVVVMRHHTSVVRMLGWGVHIAADKWMAEKADHVITVSEAAKQYMREVDGIRRDDIEVVHIGFDFEKLAPNVADRERVRREFGFEDDDLVIGYIATFVEGKGHLQLIEAFRRLIADIPNARLLLIGESAGMLDEVRRAAGEFAAGSVVVAGFRDDVPACLSAMNLFIQPSLSEAFSRVLVEAMGAGLPVIATRVGGAAEVISDGENGLLVEPDDPEALYSAALKLNCDPAVRASIAKKGSAFVRERFTADHMVERLTELYERWLPDMANPDASKQAAKQ